VGGRLRGPRIVADLPVLLERHRLPRGERLVWSVQLQLEQLRIASAAGRTIDLHQGLLGVQARLAELLRPLQQELVTAEVGDLSFDRPEEHVGGARCAGGAGLHAGRRNEEATLETVRIGRRPVR
jgi:hypothetical protein